MAAENDSRECWHCGEIGHILRDCPTRQAALNMLRVFTELVMIAFPSPPPPSRRRRRRPHHPAAAAAAARLALPRQAGPDTPEQGQVDDRDAPPAAIEDGPGISYEEKGPGIVASGVEGDKNTGV